MWCIARQALCQEELISIFHVLFSATLFNSAFDMYNVSICESGITVLQH